MFIPTSDEGTSESLSPNESDQEGFSNQMRQNKKKNKKALFSDIPQCCYCAGHHDLSVCTVYRGNKYAQYDTVRNKYANDM